MSGQDFDEFPKVPLHELLGVPADTRTCLSPDGERFRIEVPLTDELRGSAMPGHGGVLSSLIDIACGNVAAGGTELWARGAFPVTTDLHIRYFRQPRKGPLVAEARATHRGKRLISVECSVTDGDQRELTRASATYIVIEGVAPPA
jgi:uncharacterized protein (TIGR00369 family)